MKKWMMLCMMEMVSGMVLAQEFDARGDSTKEQSMPQIEILTQRDRILSKVPGSVAVIDFKSIRKIAPVHGNELFRKIPGLNVVDEEGAGLRLNIGIRGLDPDRSRNVLVLEDGIPVALNPYGEPELYFTPPIDKMTGVEVLKGSGQILFGPQTTGGVVNLISANPPEKKSSTLRIKAGNGGFVSTYASYGNTIDKVGFLVSYLNKRADNIGATRFNLHDIAAKMSIALSEKAKIGIKLGLYDELSNSTYIGLTQNMYDKGGQDYLRMAPTDLLPVRRYHFSATHKYRLNNRLQLQTTAFAYSTTRDWRRQDFSFSASAANRTSVVWGNPSIPGGAIYMLKTNGHRNRQFDVAAIESQLKWRTEKQLLQAGIRLLAERVNEQFLIGNKPDAVGGNLRDVENRNGRAISLYVHDKIAITQKLEINVGLRLENFDYSRNILRGRFMLNGVTTIADTNVVASNKLMAVIPGGGFNYSLDEGVTLFGGIHRGFAPPRTKDAITSEGIALDIAQEDSWNSELGIRALLGNVVKAEFTFFSMEFKNQIIPVSQSSGNANATGLANGGKTRHLGVEAGASFDLAKQMKKNFSIVFAANATWIDSRFSANRFIPVGANKLNVKNNLLPYAPSLMVNNSIEFESSKGAGIRLSGNYVGKQFADELNTVVASADGRNGLLTSRYITDLSAFARLSKKQILFSLAIKNLTNERYIVSRRPQGIRVGIDRQIVLGMEIKW
jgi:Fe(3+) dicitrate transport protein